MSFTNLWINIEEHSPWWRADAAYCKKRRCSIFQTGVDSERGIVENVGGMTKEKEENPDTNSSPIILVLSTTNKILPPPRVELGSPSLRSDPVPLPQLLTSHGHHDSHRFRSTALQGVCISGANRRMENRVAYCHYINGAVLLPSVEGQTRAIMIMFNNVANRFGMVANRNERTKMVNDTSYPDFTEPSLPKTNTYRISVETPEEKRPLWRPRCRWDNNIKMDLREVGYDARDWINLAQDRDPWRAYVRAAMNLGVL
ncbi:hypothetical protein ANN_12485 [Periplaneta americana]|uniref:Uncharacterized protein n=1 Tax=Periplaneta americana TaxID=6978 RepID=A0ABQ8TJE8_PERAM|nr:hypothetical protein ANN_12485 [Periplaneta americana]